jgi:nicotinate dehydrogenase subunit B
VKAAAQLKVIWKPTPRLPDMNDVETALRANPSTPRILIDKGNVDAALAAAAKPMQRTYIWPYQMHGSIGPSCAVADCQERYVRVWSGTQNPHILRTDLALLLQRQEPEIEVIRMEAAGCYGRNCADDVSADAVLLSRAVGRPVRVQLTREQEHAWEPKGTAQLMDVKGGLRADGSVAGYDFATRYPSNGAPTLTLLLTGAITPTPEVFEMGDRTAIPPYDYDAIRVVAHDMPPIVRASWFRGVSALPNTFAHESYIDELATEAGVDPIEYRLRYLRDPRAVDLVNAVAGRAGWTPRPVWKEPVTEGDVVRGVPVDIEELEPDERAHRQHGRRVGTVAPTQTQGEREPAALREPGDHGFLALHPALGAGGVEQVVDEIERLREAGERGLGVG